MELAKTDFPEAEGLFGAFGNHMSIRGVTAGLVPGRIFADESRRSAAAVTPQGIFLGGSLANTEFFSNMNTVLKQDILPGYEKRGQLDYVVFYPANAGGEEASHIVTRDLYPMRSKRMTFSHNMSDVAPELSGGIYEVNGELLSGSGLSGLDDVVEEISEGWISVDEFLNRGFGCVAIADGNILGWCLTDWVVGEECEIGIETNPGYRRQGYGHKMAAGTLTLASKRNIRRTGWQCWADNSGSIATAKSAGFELLAEFPVLFAWANPLNNMLVNGNYYMAGRADLNIPPDFTRSAWSYEQALDKGWDWGGNASLYWNCACMLFKRGQRERAANYYRLALEKGWDGIERYTANPYVYSGADSEEIISNLTKARA